MTVQSSIQAERGRVVDADLAWLRITRRVAVAGDVISTKAADAASHPLCQIGVLGFCAIWWASGLPTDVLTATLSILAITLTQMVLNRQKLRDGNDHRRDVAMHAKLDELLRAETNARKELTGIEELESAEIIALKTRLAGFRPRISRPSQEGPASTSED